jgi:hypothetical protein
MSERAKLRLDCRAVRKHFKSFAGDGLASAEIINAVERHLESCARCAGEHRIFTLSRAVLVLSASPEPVRPDEAFFKGLRARITRGPESIAAREWSSVDETWAGALWVTARQLIPAMAMLLALIIGASLLWSSAPASNDQMALRPRERILFNDIYDYPAPTQDDVLESLVTVEDK